MKLLKLSGLVPAAMMAVALTACGGNKPDIDQVKADFENPSGSVKDEQAVAGVAGKRDASNGALGVIGGGVPGASLTAYGKKSALEKLSPMNLFGARTVALKNIFATNGIQRGALRAAQFEGDAGGCGDSPEAQQAFESLFQDLYAQAASGSSSVEGDASFSLDVSSCSGGEATGTINVDLTIKAEQTGENSGSFEMTYEMELVDLCETGGEQVCVNGNMIMQASMQGAENSGNLEFIQAYDLEAKSAAGDAVKAKGGVRFGVFGDENGGTAKVEYLFYAKSTSGEEVSFVLEIVVNSDGSATLKYKGSDGELECSQDASGNGMCTGNGPDGAIELSWTEEEADAFAELE
jgi:hypothetical protein